jgi:hypothetical protein
MLKAFNWIFQTLIKAIYSISVWVVALACVFLAALVYVAFLPVNLTISFFDRCLKSN